MADQQKANQQQVNQQQTDEQEQATNPNTIEGQDFQPEQGSLASEEEKLARRRHSIGTERVRKAQGEATEEA